MSEQNTYVIGDVHGCFHTLKKLISKLPRDSELIFVGDLCDKGLHSKEVIDFVMTNNYACVKGNHEHLMEKYLYDVVINGEHSPWSEDYRYGGIQTYESYKDDHESMLRHLEWIKTLPMYIQKGNFFITHGYALPYYEHKNNEEYYNQFLLSRYEEGVTVVEENKSGVVNVFGHCVFDEVIKNENFMAIDTGCAYGKKLTCIDLETMKIIQEPMDVRDSNYVITELELEHLELSEDTIDLASLTCKIDRKFEEFDVVSTEVAAFIVEQFGEAGRKEIINMLDKKQLFIKQAKKFLNDKGE